MHADIGFIGLAVMGENLVLNMERNGYTVAVHNRSTEVLDSFISGRGEGKKLIRCATMQELAAALRPPRTVMLMIKAGSAVDQVIGQLSEHLEPGDIIIDGGNSNWEDSVRRTAELEKKGFRFIGSGVSGGEEGALNGPSIMPGGSTEAWPFVKPIFTTIAAKAPDASPCCEWMGPDGAGHFVKMVHNGIEYGDMQIVSEAYWIMKELAGLSCVRMQSVFADWNKGKLDSYLISITADILKYRESDGTPIIDRILDTAGQKGTGKWTGISALTEGVPLTLIVESVFARSLSAAKELRLAAAALYGAPAGRSAPGDEAALIRDLHDAVYAAKIVSYAQGFDLLREASRGRGWKLDLASIARIWRGGCIIRSAFLDKIAEAYTADPELANLALSPYFAGELKSCEAGWRRVVTAAMGSALPIPALAAALSWFDGFRSERLPANLLQAQRDYFGAHTYERTDRPRGDFFHTDWTGSGGSTTSRSYTV